MSYRFCDCFSASVGVADTVGPQINQRAFFTPAAPALFQQGPDSETYKTYMGSVALTAPDSWGFLAGSTLYGGAVNGYNSGPNSTQFLPTLVGKAPYPGANSSSYYAGATVATPLKELRLGVAWDWLELHDWPGQTWAIGGYASLQATEKLSFHLRGEYLKDSCHVLFAPPTDQVLDVTLTAQYDLWKNVITRVEFRWDHSLNDDADFGGTIQGIPQEVNAYMLGANIIYRF
jgi:hypothetical protein